MIGLPDSIKRRIIAISGDAPTGREPLKGLLFFLSVLYGALARWRVRHYACPARTRKLPCLVISIGNLIAGGTGKTPTTLHLSAILSDMGYRVVILSRGYKGTAEKQGALVSDGRSLLLGPDQAGDEPYLMACLLPHVPVIVGADRFDGGCLAMKLFRPDFILLDDGFQHLQLYRDLNILLLDARAPLGNGFLLPRGRLREPPEALQRADVLIYTRADSSPAAFHPDSDQLDPGHRPVFHCRHRSLLRHCMPRGRACQPGALREVQTGLGPLPKAALFAFSGLAHNERFWDSVREMGGILAGSRGYGDHHAYSLSDVADINQAALRVGSRYIVTTDKDFVRLPADSRFVLDLLVCGVEIEFDSETGAWNKFLTQWLKDSRHE